MANVASFVINRMKPSFVSLVTPRSGREKHSLNLFSYQSGCALADHSSVNFTNWRHLCRGPGKKGFVRRQQIFQVKGPGLYRITQITRYSQDSLARDAEQD